MEVHIAKGLKTDEAARKEGITEQTYYRWRREYGGLKVNQAKRLKELEKQNVRLKKLLACRVFDRVTTGEAGRPPFVCGAEHRGGEVHIIPDGVLLQKLNELSPHSLARMSEDRVSVPDDILDRMSELVDRSIEFSKSQGAAFRKVSAEVIAVLIPSGAASSRQDAAVT